MSYRNKTEIYGEEDDPAWRAAWWQKTLLVCGYGVVLLWLWDRTGFPESFGVEIHGGKSALFEDLYYSHLLLQRHTLLDVTAFAWMWTPVVGFIAWVTLGIRKDRQAKHLPASNLNSLSNSDAEK